MRFYLRALSYFRDDAPLIAAGIILVAFSTLCGALYPFLFANLIDLFEPEKPTFFTTSFQALSHFLRITSHETFHQVILLGVLALVLRVLQELCGMGQRILNAYIGYHGLVRARCDLFRKLQELSIAYHKSQPQGDAIYRLSYDTFGFQTVLNVFVNNLLISAFTLIYMAVFMFRMNWQLGLMTLAVAPLLLIATQLFAAPMKRSWLLAKEVDTKLTTAIQRSVASIGLVQAFGRESDEFSRFQGILRRSVGANLRQVWQESAYWLVVGLIFGGGYGLLLGYGGWLALQHVLGISSVSVFLIYVNQVYGPLQSISASGASVQAGVASVQRVFEVLDREVIIRDAPGAVHLPVQPRKLTLRDVGFEYRTGESVLSDVSAEIEPGKMVAFVGSSGVGKSTLLSLLPRFYDPTRGALLLDGVDVRGVRLKDLRAHVALVLQENLILPTTVRENIAYGRPGASDAQVRHAASLAGAAEFIDAMPDGFNTEIDENGSNLSGGQRQRIGIARALLTESPFLVLDEPTSALDPKNEALFLKTLHGLKKQRTIILVSHRLTTVADCDEIFVMDEGRIVEHGTSAQLLAAHGLYYSMNQQGIHNVEQSSSAEI